MSFNSIFGALLVFNCVAFCVCIAFIFFLFFSCAYVCYVFFNKETVYLGLHDYETNHKNGWVILSIGCKFFSS